MAFLLLPRVAPRASRCSRRGLVTARLFTTLGPRMKPTAPIALKVSQDRLLEDLHFTCQWGPGERWGKGENETGMSRLALSDTDKSARDWFAKTTTALGCQLTVDAMGNMFAARPGKKSGAPTYIGSHLDTQPTGGRYDGILGILAGIEMLKTLHESKFETEYPVGVVNWTNEEGARFPLSMVSSGVWAGEIPLEKAYNLVSVSRGEPKATMRSELERIGYLGKTACSHEAVPMAAHFELHIEQGPILEKEKRKIGIVQGVQAYRWFTVHVTGRDSHTGTTDLGSRQDALLAASAMIVAAREVAWTQKGLISVGIIEANPGSVNTVPGRVKFSLDIRAAADKTVDAIEIALLQVFAKIGSGKETVSDRGIAPLDKVKVEWSKDFDSPAINFHPDCIACVTEATKDLFGEEAENLSRPMVSGAGHDSVYASKRVPTTMVFVPSKNGVSHNPEEYTSPEDCAVGAQVLLNAVLRYDGKRSS